MVTLIYQYFTYILPSLTTHFGSCPHSLLETAGLINASFYISLSQGTWVYQNIKNQSSYSVQLFPPWK